FFFSSRRRHTRWPRDWSSDVCSSDLARGRRGAEITRPRAGRGPGAAGESSSTRGKGSSDCAPARAGERRGTEGRARQDVAPQARSEERRVGKEGRARGGADGTKKKDH